MAIKINLAAALLVALVAVATATSYTTTVTTTTFEDEANQGQQQQCQRQLQGRRFRSCQRYLSQRGRPYTEEEEVIENPGQQQQQLQECCQQLRNVNEQCRCEAIKHAVRQLQQQEGQQQTGQSQQVYQRATDLPRKCNMRPQQCQIRVVFV
ncbi:hypothetical protein PHJA_001797200 [Phtheirospermum japonicum]|uniref:Bifunctional inhibitor/plant lipid transfer protein/seed storage helical domain-containing protein n=1 Tax=Phtheirospermum japonicum TaxID=374723 RepID=A0A830CQD1_9LAMI|nr:hypothetical protein PHJA_001797200 [Phtheirospermum japonicum]